MIRFYAELWDIHQLFVLQVLNEKKKKFQQENEKIGQGAILCRNTVLECHNKIPIEPTGVMSQQGSSRTQARNEDYRDIILDRLTDFCHDNGFLCRDKAGEVHKE